MKQKLAIITVLISILLEACSPKPGQTILGKWQNDDDGIITEFFEDGTMTIKNSSAKTLGSDSVTGNWMILSDGRLKISFSVLGMTHTQTGVLKFPTKDTVIIQDESGKSTMMRL